jgi:hypothetical protein
MNLAIICGPPDSNGDDDDDDDDDGSPSSESNTMRASDRPSHTYLRVPHRSAARITRERTATAGWYRSGKRRRLLASAQPGSCGSHPRIARPQSLPENAQDCSQMRC